MRTGVFPGHWGPSGAKLCVLSDLVPSGASKPDYATRPVRDSRIVKEVRRLGLTDLPSDPPQHPLLRLDRDLLQLAG